MGVMQVRRTYQKPVLLTGEEAPEGPVVSALSTSMKSSLLTLSNSNRTATFNAAGIGWVMFDGVTTLSEKVYFEVVVDSRDVNTEMGVGVANALAAADACFGMQRFNAGSATLDSQAGVVSGANYTDVNSPSSTDLVFSSVITVGDRAEVAIDVGAQKIWFRKGGGAWNPEQAGVGTQNPATGEGGLTIGIARPYHVAIGGGTIALASTIGDQFTACFASADWAHAAPSGFTELFVCPTQPDWIGLGVGDRTASITVTENGVKDAGAGPINNLVDGGSVTVVNDTVATYFAATTASGKYIRFDFGSGVSVAIDEAVWYQDLSNAQGSWKWQGSNDASSWTDIGSAFTLAGVSGASGPIQYHTQLNGNVTGYRYYQLLGVSGSALSSPYCIEARFRQVTL